MALPSKARQLTEDDIPSWHIVPVGDIKEHVNSPYCWCEPVIDPCSDGLLYIHNALDGREGDLH